MKPRVLIVGTAYAIPEHRKKLEFLAVHFDLTCVTARECRGFGWIETTETEFSNAYRLVGLPIAGAATAGTRCWYRGLSPVFREGCYDLILVENEPWGVLRWQSWLLKTLFQHQAVFGEFTWENIVRTGWKGWVLRLIYWMAAETSDFVVGGNRDAVALMRRSGAKAMATACVPQFGVDTERFFPLSESEKIHRRREAGFSADVFLIAFCGRLVPEKGVQDVVDAFQRVKREGREIGLLVVGAGVLELELRELSRRDTRIQVLPPQRHSELAGVLQLVDLLVLPSRTLAGPRTWWREQFGHILIEAMACGAAAIGSDCGAIPDVLEDSTIIFPEGDVNALTALLQSLLTVRGRLDAVRSRQRERMLENYSQAKVAEQWTQVFFRHLTSQNGEGTASKQERAALPDAK